MFGRHSLPGLNLAQPAVMGFQLFEENLYEAIICDNTNHPHTCYDECLKLCHYLQQFSHLAGLIIGPNIEGSILEAAEVNSWGNCITRAWRMHEDRDDRMEGSNI